MGADWYLREWAERAGKKQADLVRDLDWGKNNTNKLWHRKQSYNRSQVAQAAEWLGIQPFELLLAPESAIALRQIRAAAATIVDIDLNPNSQSASPSPEGAVSRAPPRGPSGARKA